MKIELTKIKISRHLSEETTAFTAVLVVNGVPAAYASNHGTGGSNSYHHIGDSGRALLAEAEEYAKTLPPLVYRDMTFEMDLDLFVGELLEKHEAAGDLRRGLVKKVMFLKDGKVWESRARGRTAADLLTGFRLRNPGAAILNDMPFDDALAAYINATKI